MVSTDTTFLALAMAIVKVDRVGLLVVVMKTVVQDSTDGVSRIDKIALDGSEKIWIGTQTGIKLILTSSHKIVEN